MGVHGMGRWMRAASVVVRQSLSMYVELAAAVVSWMHVVPAAW